MGILDQEGIRNSPTACNRILSGAELSPMSDEARLGCDLFFSQRVNCSACHVGPNLADLGPSASDLIRGGGQGVVE